MDENSSWQKRPGRREEPYKCHRTVIIHSNHLASPQGIAEGLISHGRSYHPGLVSKGNDGIHISITIRPPCPLFNRVCQISECSCTIMMSSRERVKDFSMNHDGFKILSTRRWVRFELITDSFEIRTTVDLVWFGYGSSFYDCLVLVSIRAAFGTWTEMIWSSVWLEW